MNSIFHYISDFTRSIDKVYLIICAIFVAILITVNYRYQLETKILYSINHRGWRFAGFYLLYLIAFLIPWLIWFLFFADQQKPSFPFWLLVFIAPAIFAAKVTAGGWKEWIYSWQPGYVGKYWAIISDWPIRLFIVLLLFWILGWIIKTPLNWHGLQTTTFSLKPYLIMLAVMVPLIAFASSQSDFLSAYPKYKQITFMYPYTKSKIGTTALFELAYGIDFITIELFFRGFLVILFARYGGIYAIVPMAVFYCSIHFGKPMLECISSFFGGMLLGIVSYYTQSIVGGLLVHLGIAWMMELGSFLGHWYKESAS